MSASRSARLLIIAAMTTATLGFPLVVLAAPIGQRDPAQYNLPKSRLAIDGYDPVAYFPEGSSSPKKGSDAISHTHNGITYRFATKANRDLFAANPARYEPAYGGWCAYAMGEDGSTVEIDPKSYIVEGGRLFLFYKDIFNDTRSAFLKNEPKLKPAADTSWKKTSGEESRDVPKLSPSATPAPTPTTAAISVEPGLQSQLDTLKASFQLKAKPETVALYDDGIRQVAESDVLRTALKRGATAPDFTLADAKGQTVNLASMLKQGPVVLTWYRGGWCPYCNVQLKAYQDILPELKASGAQLVALSPELPDNSLSTAEKDKLTFSVVTDKGNATARSYGLAYRLPESLVIAFKGRLDLPKINGDESWTLPLAATYVVAPDGKISYAFVSADYTKRAEPADVLAAVRAAAASAPKP